MSFQSPCLDRVIHLLPFVELGGPVVFVRDLAMALPGIHSVVTLTPAPEADDTTDKMFAGVGVSVFYADTPVFTKGLIDSLSGSHVVMHGVQRHQVESADDICNAFPTVYYGYHVSDSRVKASKRFVADQALDPAAELLGPGVDRGEVRRNMKRHSLGKRTGVGLLFGSLRSYDAALVTDCIYELDLEKYHLMVSNPTTLRTAEFPGLTMTLDKMVGAKQGTRCPFVFGNVPNYLNYCQVLINTGCQRINAEAGAAEIPVLPRANRATDIHTLLNRFSDDEVFRQECAERSRKALRENDIRVTSITIRDALFDIRV